MKYKRMRSIVFAAGGKRKLVIYVIRACFMDMNI